MYNFLECPKCQTKVKDYINPLPTVDIIVCNSDYDFVLIERKNPPLCLALPGGFVDYGETVEAAALRELKEETNLEGELLGILGVYSDPKRDLRSHNISITFLAKVSDFSKLKAGDDAQNATVYNIQNLPDNVGFDHNIMLKHFQDYLAQKRQLLPITY